MSGTLDEATPATPITYTVVLQSAPTANVDIAITKDAQLTSALPAMLTFTPVNWNVPQTVTVTVFDDLIAEASPHTGTITHTATSVDAKFVGTFPAWVDITDNDSGVGINAPATVGVNEGSSNIYSMTLQKLPTAPVTITITPDPQLTFVPATLTFTPTNWATPQTITVSAMDDLLLNGDRTLTIPHVASGAPEYVGVSKLVDITIVDDETPPPPPPLPGAGNEGSFAGSTPSPVVIGGNNLGGGEGGFGRSVKRQADAPQGTLLGPYVMREGKRTQVRAGNVLPTATNLLVFNSAHSRATPQSAGLGLAGILVLTGLGIGLGLPLAYGAYKHFA